jgi:hypothetical protein
VRVGADRLSDRRTETARLRGLGFKTWLVEDLVTPRNTARYGVSEVEEFTSHRSAATEVRYQAARSTLKGPAMRFDVPGIPGAIGFEHINRYTADRNVIFADGRFAYIVNAGWTKTGPNSVSRAEVIAAARRLYRRVHGR